MKIAIVGVGAIGSLLAALLSRSKEEVWALDTNKERIGKILRQGIAVEGLANFKADLKATTDAQDIGQADLAVICTKSYHTKDALAFAKPVIGSNTVVLTLQNGFGNVEVISEIIGSDRVLGGVTNAGATLIDHGKVRYAGKGETVIGMADGRITIEMRHIRELFNKVGLETKISRDIKSLIWSKLIINVGINALTAITRLNNGSLIEFDGTRKIMREAATEAVKVAKRKRVKLVYDDPLAKVEAVCEATGTNISSMLQDVLAKKRTEIDFINGVIVRQGQEMGIATPVNSLLVDLVKTIESSYGLAK